MKWITLISYSNTIEIHPARIKLESEGIEVFLKDELSAQMNSGANYDIGGVKLQVFEKEYNKAKEILLEAKLMTDVKLKYNNKFYYSFILGAILCVLYALMSRDF